MGLCFSTPPVSSPAFLLPPRLALAPRPTLNATPLNARIKLYVATHLRDPHLSLSSIASAFACSKRTLHNAFTPDGISLSQYIWCQRLQQCHRQLASHHAASLSITDIALGWGFSNPGHFSTLFRARYHISPRQYRKLVTPGKQRTAPSLSSLHPSQRLAG